MANTIYPRGFVNPRLVVGGEPATYTYAVSTTYAATFYPGDPVMMRTDGFVSHKDSGLAANVATFLGVCRSFLGKTPADGKTRGIQVITDLANVTFEIMLTSPAAFTQTRIGENVSWTGAGGVGRPRVYQSTVAATGAATGIFRILGAATNPDNDGTLANPVIVVKFRALAGDGIAG